VTRIAFDGENYGHPTKPIIELGLSVFHARALDISIRMMEQSFNKMDMLSADDAPAKNPLSAKAKGQTLAQGFAAVEKAARSEGVTAESFGVVVPFRSRAQLQAMRV
jgi:hypothetical protein